MRMRILTAMGLAVLAAVPAAFPTVNGFISTHCRVAEPAGAAFPTWSPSGE